jgi:hypothetical protein
MTLLFSIRKLEMDCSSEHKRVKSSFTQLSLRLVRLPWSRYI